MLQSNDQIGLEYLTIEAWDASHDSYGVKVSFNNGKDNYETYGSLDDDTFRYIAPIPKLQDKQKNITAKSLRKQLELFIKRLCKHNDTTSEDTGQKYIFYVYKCEIVGSDEVILEHNVPKLLFDNMQQITDFINGKIKNTNRQISMVSQKEFYYSLELNLIK